MNKAILVGNLTRDPEFRTTPGGASVCTFSVAVNRRFSNQQGEKVTDYFNIVTWRALADTCSKYLKKGNKVGIVGELQTRSYDGKDGVKRYVTEIVAAEVDFLTPRGSDGGDYQPRVSASAPDIADAPAADGFQDVEDDDLPF